MKKLILLFGLVVTMTITATKAKAQISSGNTLNESSFAKAAATAGLILNDKCDVISNANSSADLVDPHALKHFQQNYKVDAVQWIGLKDGYMANFVENGINTKVYYHKNGKFSGLMKGYDLNKMNPELSNRIYMDYLGYEILYTIEVQLAKAPNSVIYFVDIRKGDNIKMIKISDDDVDVVLDSSTQNLSK